MFGTRIAHTSPDMSLIPRRSKEKLSMSIDRLGKELEALGVSGRDIRCLLLLPQIYVGWASERRDPGALEGLLHTTATGARFGADCVGLARGWMFERPSRAQFQSAFALMRALGRAPDAPLFGRSDLLESMLWAIRAARLDREPAPGKRRGPVTLAARRALIDLESWLEVDTRNLWADLLSEDAEEARPAAFAALSDAELEGATSLLDGPAGVFESRSDDSEPPVSAPFPLVRPLPEHSPGPR
jgi:hypothetical protein